MFDVFYIGKKPNLFPHEQSCESIEQACVLSRTRYFWIVTYLADYAGFDFLWEPPPWQSHQTHVWPSQWHQYSGTYLVPRQDHREEWNFHTRIIPNRSCCDNWHILYPIDETKFDWSWAPHPLDPPYIYVFGNQHWSGEYMPTVEYRVLDATERKYMDAYATLSPNRKNWTVLDAVDEFTVDYTWVPDPGDPPYVYVFGNQHYDGTIMPSAIYTVPGATQEKFIDHARVKLKENRDHWQILEPIDEQAWDWSWVPDPNDPPYVYVFGNQWWPPELRASIKYSVPGATEVKYMEQRTRRLPQPDLFERCLPVAEFDWSWEPDPTDPPYTYVFGNQWNPGVLEPTVKFTVPGATEVKYIDDCVAKLASVRDEHWHIVDDIEEFDYSWRPNPTDPPYIYVFGNQWLLPEVRPALEYHVPGATERKYMDHPRARRQDNPENFVQLYPCEFDWSWEPDPGSPAYIYVFGNQYYPAEIMPTVEYAVPGATERKFMDISASLSPCQDHWHKVVDCEWDYTWRPEPGSPTYVYVFGNQWWPAEKMPTVEYHMPGATERKYMDAPVAQLPIDMTHWHIPEHVDITDMDFSWVPDPGEPPYIYQFATQHQKTGGPQYRVPGAVEIKYLDMMRAAVTKEAVPIFEIDHMDGNAGQIPNTVRKVRYFDNYRDTLMRLARNLKGEYEHVWVCSSICDYTNFDFSWHPEIWQSTMLHVFASDDQKFGDTFYMYVPTFAARAEKKALLEWTSVNYVPRIRVPRRPMPVVRHAEDSHVDQVKAYPGSAPLTLFTNRALSDPKLPAVNLWREEVKTVVPLDSGSGAVIVPKVAIPYIKTQVYDYPHIDKTRRSTLSDYPLDVIFISNGEVNAEENWERLKDVMEQTDNRWHRIDGVDGRVAAYQAAAQASTTPWFFAVFAKLYVSGQFDWNWQPDRLQQPKHYIFHARNDVNGLEYGHQAMIAYNRRMTLENTAPGLDFTLDQPHEVVPLFSGVANYAHSPWMAWRTAFREVIKLRHSLPDVENEYRLNQWLTVGRGDNGVFSVMGAQDAVEYYESVGGDFAELRKTYEWSWLATYASMKRPQLFTQSKT